MPKTKRLGKWVGRRSLIELPPAIRRPLWPCSAPRRGEQQGLAPGSGRLTAPFAGGVGCRPERGRGRRRHCARPRRRAVLGRLWNGNDRRWRDGNELGGGWMSADLRRSEGKKRPGGSQTGGTQAKREIRSARQGPCGDGQTGQCAGARVWPEPPRESRVRAGRSACDIRPARAPERKSGAAVHHCGLPSTSLSGGLAEAGRFSSASRPAMTSPEMRYDLPRKSAITLRSLLRMVVS